MTYQSNVQMLRSMKASGSWEQLVAGHSQVPTKAALNNLRFQIRKEQDVHEDPFLDMMSRCCDHNKDFVRHVSYPPFTAFLMKSKQAEIYESWFIRTEFRRAFIDATGSILAKMKETILLHHVLLIQVKISNDNTHTPFCLAELISGSQSMKTITDFLSRAQETIREDCHRDFSLMFHEIVTDKSFANIGAILRSFNDMNLTEYLDLCWKILKGDLKANKDLKTLVVVRLCSSHTTKTMSDLLKQHYKDREVCFKLAASIGIMFSIGDLDLLLEYAKIFLFGVSTPKLGINAAKNSAALKDIVRNVGKFLNDDDPQLFKEEDFVDTAACRENEDIAIITEDTVVHNAIYKNSKCYQELNEHIHNCEYDSEGSENRFFSSNFAHSFLRNHLSYVILWGRVMTYLRSKNSSRANNGAIENHFMLKKKDAREATLKIGAFGKVACGRYVQFLSDVTDATIKGIEYDIPARSRSRNSQKDTAQRSQSQPNQITESGIIASSESYKKRVQRGKKKSVFFSQNSQASAQSEEE